MSVVELNDDALARLYEEQGFRRIPTISILPAIPGKTKTGDYTPPGFIRLLLHDERMQGRLPHVISALNRTLLHELRHHWQFENWGTGAFDDKPGAYIGQRHEIDARDFADANAHRYRLIRVKRRPQTSGFSKLGKGARR